ncbi:hypothetical protein KIPB_005755 [Kipferlia bialata]|uniref:C2H2-type domain-containing protein n=1 Tax=Kipferlia bialata TaxID=797122 RepID=A0A9K3CXG2_9EUKA|nr:hypothetical protein KIPB_005755 [Kipferlia bialata]|eukprot:g5755.t1
MADVCAGTGLLLKRIAAASADRVTSLVAVDINDQCLAHLKTLSLDPMPMAVVKAEYTVPGPHAHDSGQGRDHRPPCHFINLSSNTQSEVSASAAACTYLMAQPIVGIDFEWKPCFQKGGFNPISIIQLATLDRVFVLYVRIGTGESVAQSNPIFTRLLNPEVEGRPLLLIKDPTCDSSMYPKSFGVPFPPTTCIHTVLKTLRLGSLNVGVVCGTLGLGASPKSKKVSMSNWNQWPLTRQQQLYAAFDPYFNVLCAHTLATVIRQSALTTLLTGMTLEKGSTSVASPAEEYSYTSVVRAVENSVTSDNLQVIDSVGQVVPEAMHAGLEYRNSVYCSHCEAKFKSFHMAVVHDLLYHGADPTAPEHTITLDYPCVVCFPVPGHVIAAVKGQVVELPSDSYFYDTLCLGAKSLQTASPLVKQAVRAIVKGNWRRPDILDLVSTAMQSVFVSKIDTEAGDGMRLSAEAADWVLNVDWDLSGTPYSGCTPRELLSVMQSRKNNDPRGVCVINPYTGLPVKWRSLRGILLQSHAEELAAVVRSGSRHVFRISTQGARGSDSPSVAALSPSSVQPLSSPLQKTSYGVKFTCDQNKEGMSKKDIDSFCESNSVKLRHVLQYRKPTEDRPAIMPGFTVMASQAEAAAFMARSPITHMGVHMVVKTWRLN